MSRTRRIALYGDVNLNIIDGSAIWLQSLARLLSRDPRNEVTVVLKAAEERDILTGELRALERVRVVNPVDQGESNGPELSRAEAMETLERLDQESRFHLVILRGYWLCETAAKRKPGPLHGRLCPYLTDIPQALEELDERHRERLALIAKASRFIFCQTEQLRDFIEFVAPDAGNKAILLTPMVPEASSVREPGFSDRTPLRLLYVGKFAPLWNTYEMTQIVERLRNEGHKLELHVYGDKIHRVRDDTDYYNRMHSALTKSDGTHWHGALSRSEVLNALPQYDVALGWRHPALDSSLELSTKLLEYGAARLPVIVNRTPMHEQLLGYDYPLFANSAEEFERLLSGLAENASDLELAAERAFTAAEAFTYERVAERLEPFLARVVPQQSASRARRVVVACHDFKFFTRIQEHLSALDGVEVRIDAWSALEEHDEESSRELLAWADTIICEWCGGNAIWYSKNKRPGQHLIIRLHRFELYGKYPRLIAFENVDRVVFVDEHYRAEAEHRLGWSPEKLTVIPNWVDTAILDRPKLMMAPFNLGMIGVAPSSRKRLDRGIEVLSRLRRYDSRFQLFVKSKHVWQYWWMWNNAKERESYRAVFDRLRESPELAQSVHFDGFGPNVGSWLRKIGWILSTSDDESFHLSPAEGMASRALGVLLPWPGADRVYPSRWVVKDEAEMAELIVHTIESAQHRELGEQARAFIEEHYSVERVCDMWTELL